MVKVGLIINLLISLLIIQQSHQLEPFITQYIIPFDLPLNDLKDAAANQLSRNEFKTNSFSADNVTVSKLTFKSIYNGTNRIIDPKEQSIFHTVWNDSIDLIVTYQADIQKLPTQKKTFNGTTKLKIYLNYTKKIIPENQTIEIGGVDVLVDKNSFEMNYTGNPNDSEKKKLDEINNGVISGKKNTTILALLQTQQMTKQIMLTYFKQNLVNQKISPTYQSTYNYQFSNVNAIFDMTTSGIKSISHGIAHQLKGTIKNFGQTSSLASKTAPYEQGFHTLFSLDFLNYFIRYNSEKNADWVRFKINKKTFPTNVFKYRLVDLEFLFQKLTAKYAQYYLNEISIICTPKTFDNWSFDAVSSNLKLSMIWNCQGWLDGPTPAALVLDFDASLNYLVEVRLARDVFEINLAKTNLQSLDFKPIVDDAPKEPEIAMFYASEIVDNLRGNTVGSNFKVKQGSSKILLKENIGIYVG